MDNLQNTAVYKDKKEYEIISHNDANFKVFIVNLLYRTPHNHKDFEIGLILRNNIKLSFPGHESHNLEKGDIYIVNPYHSHELSALSPVTILSLQIPSFFFSSFFPQINYVEFKDSIIKHEKNNPFIKEITAIILNIADSFFEEKSYSNLNCASLINRLFYILLSNLPLTHSSESENNTNKLKRQRMKRLIKHIDEHYSEKLLLNDIAQEENLDLYYLSHFFTDSFGISFQEYLSKLRCEKARSLLLTTRLSLLDIGIAVGFSDPKYFNKHFKEQYGCTPKEYRKNFDSLKTKEQQFSVLTTQEFLSKEDEKKLLSEEIEKLKIN